MRLLALRDDGDSFTTGNEGGLTNLPPGCAGAAEADMCNEDEEEEEESACFAETTTGEEAASLSSSSTTSIRMFDRLRR